MMTASDLACGAKEPRGVCARMHHDGMSSEAGFLRYACRIYCVSFPTGSKFVLSAPPDILVCVEVKNFLFPFDCPGCFM
jgi:hypothetical protein